MIVSSTPSGAASVIVCAEPAVTVVPAGTVSVGTAVSSQPFAMSSICEPRVSGTLQ